MFGSACEIGFSCCPVPRKSSEPQAAEIATVIRLADVENPRKTRRLPDLWFPLGSYTIYKTLRLNQLHSRKGQEFLYAVLLSGR